MKPMVLLITPEKELYFQSPYNRLVGVQLLLSNPSSSPVAYKIKCTDAAHYAVKPAVGIISAEQQKFPVTIVLFPLSGPNRKPSVELFDRNKQRFMIEAASVLPGSKFEAAEPSPAIAKLVLKEAEKTGNVMVTQLSCAFDDVQLKRALDDSRKSAIASIRTNAVGGNNGMPVQPTAVENGTQLSEQEEMTVMLILAVTVLIIALFYFYYYYFFA